METTSSTDKWGNRLAQWSQVAMLGLVGFGYFYTVRPVYQRDLLEEQTAKLQLEQQELIKLNHESSALLKKSEEDLASLLARRSELEIQIGQLETKLVESQRELKLLKRNSEISKAELDRLTSLNKTQNIQIVESQLKIFKDTASWVWASGYLMDDHLNVFISGESERIENWARIPFAQPIDIIINAIDDQINSENYFNLPEPHSVSRSIILDFRNKALLAREHLVCPTLDRSAWVTAWRNARTHNLNTVENCVEMHVNHTAEEEKWTQNQLASWKKSSQYKSYETSYRSACKAMSNYFADRLIADAYEKYYSPCSNRLFSAQEIADGKLDHVKPIGSPTPPLPDPAWFSGWYKDDAR